jgi:PAS domain S-box-containing protein
MDSNEMGNRGRLNRVVISVGLTAVVVIVLILMLALTIRHAREKEMVGQFGLQQAAIARGTAARLENLLSSIEKHLLALAAEPEKKLKDEKRIRDAHEMMGGKISFAVVMDENGSVLMRYPPPPSGTGGRFPWETSLLLRIRETGKNTVKKILLLPGEGENSRVMAICVPRYRDDGGFGGAAVAVFPPTAFSDEYLRFAREDSQTWLLDGTGQILFHSRRSAVGQDVESLATDGPERLLVREALLSGKDGYGEYRLYGADGRPQRHIVAHAPVRLPSDFGSVAVVTPYDNATSLVRKTFLNIMIGAAGLILAVIIAAAAIVYAGRRRIHDREARERLRERESWQEKLIREKKTIEGIIEGSPIPTFVLNRDHKIILWNRACTELTGFAAGEMIGSEKQYIPFYNEKRPVIADLIIERDFESIEKYYATKKVRKSQTVEAAYEARDFYRNLGGRNRHLYFLAAPIFDEKGEIIAAIETIQDVSKEEQMAKELREYADTLRNKLQENIHLREEIESLYNYLQSIVDSLPDRLFVLSSDGTIHYMSRDVKDGIGMISRQVRGKHFLEIVAPELRDFMKARWEEAQKGIFAPCEIEVKARDGSKRTLIISAGPVRGSDRYVILQRDITELKNLEERFYESQKMAAVGHLSAGIAHEVRNPLSSIKMSLQILEKRMHPTGNDLKRFEIALREVEHLEKLVNDVLIFAKPAMPRKERTDIRKVVEQAMALAEKGIADKGIRVQTRFADGVPVLEIDAAMIEQAFLNLILNAVDAMGERGLLELSVRMVDEDEPMVEVEIADDGCGIDAQDIPHLFNPFFTRKKYGTGLGLTQVKKIVDLHRGVVDIFSAKGDGTRVRIRFPAQRENSAGSTADGGNDVLS